MEYVLYVARLVYGYEQCDYPYAVCYLMESNRPSEVELEVRVGCEAILTPVSCEHGTGYQMR